VNEVVLAGCRVQPLAAYLKALGVFRLLAVQKDPGALLAWRDDQALLLTQLTEAELISWLLDEYRPTPVTSPWNGGSGYFPNDKSARKALERIESEEGERFEPYRKTLQDCRAALKSLGLVDKPEPKEAKPRLLRRLRSTLRVPEALEWLDAACVIGDDSVEMVPLLGTGGNDGRLDFSSNYAQNLVNLLLCTPKQRPGVQALLRQALFAEPCKGLESTAIGQYAPGAAGGPNTTSGFDGNPNVNPWDFVLTLEGSLVFSAAATRRLVDDSQGFSLPFTVNPSMGGHSSIATDEGDKARCEMWLPTWSSPISLAELRAVFAEGRAQLGARQAATGIDFARAVASLGVERGLESFERYAFLVRNGKSYFATPTGRYRVKSGQHKAVDLLKDLDPWLSRYRRKAEANGGATIRSLFRQLDDATLHLCRGVGAADLLPILQILGAVQRQLARTPKIQQRNPIENYVPPIFGLSEGWWPSVADSTELRLAMGLRGLPQLRQFIEPAAGKDWIDNREAVWTRDTLSNNLIRVCRRRFLYQPFQGREPLGGRELQEWRFGSRTAQLVQPRDLEQFLSGRTDDAEIESLLLGLLLVPVPKLEAQVLHSSGAERLPFDYCKLKLVYSAFDPRTKDEAAAGRHWLGPRTILEKVAGNQPDAMDECDRFLMGKGTVPKLRGRRSCLDPPRLAASLLFPIGHRLFKALVPHVLTISTKETADVH